MNVIGTFWRTTTRELIHIVWLEIHFYLGATNFWQIEIWNIPYQMARHHYFPEVVNLRCSFNGIITSVFLYEVHEHRFFLLGPICLSFVWPAAGTFNKWQWCSPTLNMSRFIYFTSLDSSFKLRCPCKGNITEITILESRMGRKFHWTGQLKDRIILK